MSLYARASCKGSKCGNCTACLTVSENAQWKDMIAAFKRQIEVERNVVQEKISSFPSPSSIKQLCEAARPKNRGPRPRTMISWAGKKDFSSTPLVDLKRIELRSMYAGKKHLGRYLLIRIISKPATIVSVTFAAQDPGGNACLIALYESPWALVPSNEELEAILPLGSTIAVREPYFKMSETGHPMVRVDSPTDVVFLNEERDLAGLEWKSPAVSQRPPSLGAEEYKVLGNGFLAKGWLVPAERAYSEGLRLEPDHVPLRLNRSQARLKFGLYRSALSDAKFVLALDRSTYPPAQLEKALFRAASSEYALQLFEPAQKRYRELVQLFPASKEGRAGLDKVAARIREAETGEYDLEGLFISSQKNPHLDVADYTHPDLAIEGRKGRGRGVVASKSIRVGSLLMLAKPFASCYDDECKGDAISACLNLHNDSPEGSAQGHLTKKIAKRLLEDPSTAEALDLLYAGPTYHTPPSFAVSKVLPKEDVTEFKPVDIDISRIELVRTLNSFAIRRLGPALEPGPDGEFRNSSSVKYNSPAALYILPSLFNHSCLPNATWYCMGSSIVIKLIRCVKPGEEITISYATGFSYPERTALLKGHGIDKCQCGLCDEERRDPSAMHELRQALKYEMTDTQGAHMLVPANEVNVTRHFSVVLEIVEELKRTYNSTFPEHLKHELYSPYTELRLAAARLSEMSARADSRATWLQRSMLYGKKALECVGNIGIELGPNGLNFPIIELEPVNEGIVFLVEVYRNAGRLQESKQLAKLVTMLNAIAIGDANLFFRRYDIILRDYHLTRKDF